MPHELTKPEREAIVAHIKGLGDAEGEEMRSFEVILPERPPLFVKQSDDILVKASTRTSYTFLPKMTSQPLEYQKSSMLSLLTKATASSWRRL